MRLKDIHNTTDCGDAALNVICAQRVPVILALRRGLNHPDWLPGPDVLELALPYFVAAHLNLFKATAKQSRPRVLHVDGDKGVL